MKNDAGGVPCADGKRVGRRSKQAVKDSHRKRKVKSRDEETYDEEDKNDEEEDEEDENDNINKLKMI